MGGQGDKGQRELSFPLSPCLLVPLSSLTHSPCHLVTASPCPGEQRPAPQEDIDRQLESAMFMHNRIERIGYVRVSPATRTLASRRVDRTDPPSNRPLNQRFWPSNETFRHVWNMIRHELKLRKITPGDPGDPGDLGSVSMYSGLD